MIARFVPAIQNIKSHYDAAEKAAISLLKERAANGTIAPDLFYWMAENAKGDEKDLAFLAGILLKVSFAGSIRVQQHLRNYCTIFAICPNT